MQLHLPRVTLHCIFYCSGCDRMLHHGCTAWDRQQHLEVLRTGRRHFRLLDAFNGVLTRPFVQTSSQLLLGSTAWEVIPQDQRTHQARSLAFAMLAQAVGGVFFFIAKPHLGYPFRLWQLIDSERDIAAVARRLDTDSKCLMARSARTSGVTSPPRLPWHPIAARTYWLPSVTFFAYVSHGWNAATLPSAECVC